MKTSAIHRVYWNKEELAAFTSMFKELLPTCHEGNFTKFARRVQGKAHIHPRRRRPMAGPSSVSPELREAWFSKFPQAKGTGPKTNGATEPSTTNSKGVKIGFSIGGGAYQTMPVSDARDLYDTLKLIFG